MYRQNGQTLYNYNEWKFFWMIHLCSHSFLLIFPASSKLIETNFFFGYISPQSHSPINTNTCSHLHKWIRFHNLAVYNNWNQTLILFTSPSHIFNHDTTMLKSMLRIFFPIKSPHIQCGTNASSHDCCLHSQVGIGSNGSESWKLRTSPPTLMTHGKIRCGRRGRCWSKWVETDALTILFTA